MNLLKHKYFGIFVLFVLSCIPLLDLLHPGIPLTHDLQDHVARITNFYANLTQGNFIPRWAGNLNWGYGTPILMFLYPLPSYIASLFHFIGFSFQDSVKVEFALAFIASGFAMYLWVNEFLGNTAGVVASALYLFAPYRFVEMYVRGDIGEHLAFVFPPIVMFFLLKLSKKYSYQNFLGISLSVAFLILAHNAFAVMFLPLIFLYWLFLCWQQKWKKSFFISGIASIVLGIGLSSFFLIPAYFEGKYTLRDIVTGDEFSDRFVKPFQFFWMPWSYGGTDDLSKQVGIAQWVGIIISLITIWKLRKKDMFKKYFFIGLLVIFLGALFMMTQYSFEIWHIVTLLQKFQFPWRFLAVVVFITAVIGGYAVSSLKNKSHILVFAVILVSIAFVQNAFYFHARGFEIKPESFYSGIYNGTTDTGESSPIWSIRFMEHRADSPLDVISGNASITQGLRTITNHAYIVNVSSPVRLVENTLYFPGWNIFVDGSPVPIQYQDPAYRGLMTFTVSSGNHTVDVRFTDTKLRMISDIISVISILVLSGVWILYKKKYEIIS